MAESTAALVVSLLAVALYSYAIFYLSQERTKIAKNIELHMPPGMAKYGQYKFLTYQCLLIQLVSAVVHVLAHFLKPLRYFRDLLFTALAYPVGSIVVYTFWAVWHLVGREFIFPRALEAVYPAWLNHTTHTVVAPINLLLLLLVGHRYRRRGLALLALFKAMYMGLLLYIKYETGHFVYPYLNKMSETELYVYFTATAVLAYIMYKSGHLLNQLLHGRAGGPTGATGAAAQRAPAKRKQK